MNEREFYDYIIEHFNLDGTANRLIRNIIEYIRDQEFVDAEDAQYHLKSLLDGAFGITEHEIKLYRAPECENCGQYVANWNYDNGGTVMCINCRKAENINEKQMDD